MMTLEDLERLNLRIGKILHAERVQGSDKLLKFTVSLGELGERQIIAGIGKAYEPSVLLGRQIVVVADLLPRTLMGLESQGMLLAAQGEGGMPVLLMPDKETDPGSGIR